MAQGFGVVLVFSAAFMARVSSGLVHLALWSVDPSKPGTAKITCPFIGHR